MENDARNAWVIRSKEMDSCDESKDINAQIADMYSKIKLVPIRIILSPMANNSGTTIQSTNKHISSSQGSMA